MEFPLGNDLQQHHPPCGQRRLLYLGIGFHSESHSPKSFFLSGFSDVMIRDGGC
jgi:hypothetical protein